MMRHTSSVNFIKAHFIFSTSKILSKVNESIQRSRSTVKMQENALHGPDTAAFDSIWLEISCIGLNVHLIHAFHTHCFGIELSIFLNLRSISTCKGQRSNLWKYLVWTGNELHLIKVS